MAEAGYLIGKLGGPPAEAEFLRALSSPRYVVVAPSDLDLRRAADLVEQYGDLPLGSTDALVMAIAKSAGDRMVATLDHRHFGGSANRTLPTLRQHVEVG